MGSLICSLCYMVITELEPSHSEDSVSQEKEIITKMYKVFFKIYVLIVFLAKTIVGKWFLAKIPGERNFIFLTFFV